MTRRTPRSQVKARFTLQRNAGRAVNGPMKNTVPRIARQFTSREYSANIVSKANANFNRDGFARSKTTYSSAACARVCTSASFPPRNIATRGENGNRNEKVETMIFHLKIAAGTFPFGSRRYAKVSIKYRGMRWARWKRTREGRVGRGGRKRGSERERKQRTTPRTTAPLESTPTFSRDSIGAFGWLSSVKVRGTKQFIRRPE